MPGQPVGDAKLITSLAWFDSMGIHHIEERWFSAVVSKRLRRCKSFETVPRTLPVRLEVGQVVLSHLTEVRILDGQPRRFGRVDQGKCLQSTKTVSANLTSASNVHVSFNGRKGGC